MAVHARIRRLLVANRGEIARRIFRTCHSMGIDTVAVYSDEDASALFVREAGAAVPLGGASAAQSYLRGDAIIEAAHRAGADAVHPGYGFLSEDEPFARACIDAGLTWVGPPPEAIACMGSKLAARELMGQAGLPVLPGLDISTLDGDKLNAAADEIGWPVIVKASYGGGGRGMRMVRSVADLAAAVESARREAAAAFGNDAVFLERYVERPRHVEVQVFGDQHGTVVHLFERECSIQRRHQKIIEEAPSPFVDERLRASMGDAAVRAARSIGYIGAGTVEFLVAPDGDFYFLEMNTRLQVEHPVTEMITGLDLVRLQLLVAQGEPLPDPACRAEMIGHAVEVRLYAEDPLADYRPSPGRLHRFRIPELAEVRVDSGFTDGSLISARYDPMLAKLIAHAPTRDEAVQRLIWSLRNSQVHGVVTNRDLLIAVLEHPEFRSASFDTAFLERHPAAALIDTGARRDDVLLATVAAALALRACERRDAKVLRSIEAGWRNNPSQPHKRTFTTPLGTLSVGYLPGRRTRLEVDGVALADVEVHAVATDHVEMLASGMLRTFAVDVVGDTIYVDSSRGSVTVRELSRFPRANEHVTAGSLAAPMPGTIVRVEVVPGERVHAGQVLVVIEAMKMEHHVTAPAAGVVTATPIQVGQAVDAGAILVVVEEEETP